MPSVIQKFGFLLPLSHSGFVVTVPPVGMPCTSLAFNTLSHMHHIAPKLITDKYEATHCKPPKDNACTCKQPEVVSTLATHTMWCLFPMYSSLEPTRTAFQQLQPMYTTDTNTST